MPVSEPAPFFVPIEKKVWGPRKVIGMGFEGCTSLCGVVKKVWGPRKVIGMGFEGCTSLCGVV
ncbi:hypothetical protein, partial [Paenibacillus donghaensis]|uniref:hypothetical protein n=1 Tax=Paenibacillus donghaensis TaxID=414771 RepID=UPI001D16939D